MNMLEMTYCAFIFGISVGIGFSCGVLPLMLFIYNTQRKEKGE